MAERNSPGRQDELHVLSRFKGLDLARFRHQEMRYSNERSTESSLFKQGTARDVMRFSYTITIPSSYLDADSDYQPMHGIQCYRLDDLALAIALGALFIYGL